MSSTLEKPPPLSLAYPFGMNGKTGSLATSPDFSSSGDALSKVTTQDFSGRQMTGFTWKNESLGGYSVSKVYRIGNTERIV